MAFYAEKINLKGKDVFKCPICKKNATKITELKPPYSDALTYMCDDCFKLCYKNKMKNRAAGDIDDTLNVSTQRRRAPILEKGSSENVPEEGWEYACPSMTFDDIKSTCISWTAIYVLIELFLLFYKLAVENDETDSFAVLLANLPLFAVSFMLLVSGIVKRMKGIRRGISKKRARALLVTFGVYIIMMIFSIRCIIG